jgi:hypothetical protein
VDTHEFDDDIRATKTHVSPNAARDGHKLHRIAEVCRQQSLSIRKLVRRLAATRQDLDRQLSPFCDMKLSQLYRWQAALDVPAIELLVAPEQKLSPAVDRRARLIKLMKSARSLQQLADSEPVRSLAEELAEQLIEIMPELESVDAWPVVGRRRTLDEPSGMEQRMLPDSVLDRTRLPMADND